MAAEDGAAALGQNRKCHLSVKLIKLAIYSNKMLSLSERKDRTEVVLQMPTPDWTEG